MRKLKKVDDHPVTPDQELKDNIKLREYHRDKFNYFSKMCQKLEENK